MKHSPAYARRGVTPVIATIILIAGTLVLALVVGAYTFGLFGSNVKTVTLSSGTLFGGKSATASQGGIANLVVSLNNPGSASYITSLTMTGSGISAIIAWDNSTSASTGTNLVSAAFSAGHTNPPCTDCGILLAGTVSSFTLYPESAVAQSITTGQLFDYVINFANGESISGSLISQ
jgi:flagellin-like protein